MPRVQQSKSRQVLEYFRTAPMELAKEILSLSKDEVAAREAKGNKVREGRERAGQSAAPAAQAEGTAPVAAVSKPKNKPRKRRGRKAAGAQAQTAAEVNQVLGEGELPLTELPPQDEPVADADELVGAGAQG